MARKTPTIAKTIHKVIHMQASLLSVFFNPPQQFVELYLAIASELNGRNGIFFAVHVVVERIFFDA